MKRIALVATCLTLLIGTGVLAQSPGECDVLAAHPDDPFKLSDGVEDGEVNVALADAACVNALTAEPDSARLMFQLGRVYWHADRDEEAVSLFNQAATQDGYPAAFAYLGIAYEYGYVPSGPDPEIARTLYQAAMEGGFEPAERLLEGLPDALPLDVADAPEAPDFSDYYQPAWLDSIYHRRFDELQDDSLKVVVYLKGMYDFFAQEVNWFDLRCAHLHDTRMTQKIISDMFASSPEALATDAEALLQQALRIIAQSSEGGIGSLINLALEVPILQDEGKRDAGHLVTDHQDDSGMYYCEADTIKRLYRNAQYFFLEEMRS